MKDVVLKEPEKIKIEPKGLPPIFRESPALGRASLKLEEHLYNLFRHTPKKDDEEACFDLIFKQDVKWGVWRVYDMLFTHKDFFAKLNKIEAYKLIEAMSLTLSVISMIGEKDEAERLINDAVRKMDAEDMLKADQFFDAIRLLNLNEYKGIALARLLNHAEKRYYNLEDITNEEHQKDMDLMAEGVRQEEADKLREYKIVREKRVKP